MSNKTGAPWPGWKDHLVCERYRDDHDWSEPNHGVVRHEWHNGGRITRGAWWKNRRTHRRPAWLKNLGMGR